MKNNYLLIKRWGQENQHKRPGHILNKSEKKTHLDM